MPPRGGSGARTAPPNPSGGAVATPGVRPAPVSPPSTRSLLTLGVEEEFLLVDARTFELAAKAATVLADADDGSGTMHMEATRFQVESASPIARTADEMHGQLLRLRRGFTEAAAARGCRLVASGTPVLRRLDEPVLADEPRRHVQRARFGEMTDTFVDCGCHVHVGTLDLDEAVRAADHLRPWLPTLIALGANSPFKDGADTGHASWRTVAGSVWPCSGIPPRMRTPERYLESLETLISTGTIMDAKMVYWDARPSMTWPTLEIRAPDVAMSVEEAVLQAVLARALVKASLRAHEQGLPVPAVRDEVLAPARWRAARDGLEGQALDPRTAELVPAHALLDDLVVHLDDELREAGDLDYVDATLARLRRDGCGAHRQRKVFEERGRFTDVVRYLADVTEARER
ncbi:carboxylate-amine ligase [Actinomadura harenae]|uniref:Putative glutamate--cysteine ligase 2 n=1 Tax=Actinomadura harenae TaxID=2483351 RepID=A0A3M2MD84_9ACTN|nr:glutamate--cysteine ligase [Actinomadura harenae]RMI47499.1 YbdK family carboxylate-amine ligase [Actinomadura harenae]